VAEAATPAVSGSRTRTRRLLLLLAAVAVAPVILSYAAYYLLPRDARVNYGTLLPTQPLHDITGARLDGKPFATAELRGRWTLLTVAGGECERPCEDALYASRQARTIQNAERDRVQRVWLVPDQRAISPALLAEHPDVVVARVDAAGLSALPEGAERIYVIDPLGNLVLAWPMQPDIKAMAKDLTRLLRASQIG
jgi:cytochrome oxidase Cu insertion factor (SCO1/SenC/PrrC family)